MLSFFIAKKIIVLKGRNIKTTQGQKQVFPARNITYPWRGRMFHSALGICAEQRNFHPGYTGSCWKIEGFAKAVLFGLKLLAQRF